MAVAFTITEINYSQLPLIGPPLIGHPRHRTQIVKEPNFCFAMYYVLPL